MNIEFKPIHNYTINLGNGLREFNLYWDFNPEEGPSVRPVRVTLTWGNVTLDTGFRGNPGYSARPLDKTFFWSHDQYGRKIQASNESTYGVGISMPSITNTYERFTTNGNSGYGSPGLITE